jgi:hypothetical protein
MKNIIYVFVVLIFVFINSCKEDEFNPIAGFEDKIIVIGILDNRSETQFIKIQKLYDRVNFGNSQKTLKNLKVELMERNNRVYSFRDTIIEGISNYSVYYNKDVKLRYGINYTLMIYDEKNILIDANTIIPTGQHSISYKGDTTEISLSSQKYDTFFYVYEYHIYIEYQQKVNTEWKTKRMEVPIQINISQNRKDTSIIYPQRSNEYIPDRRKQIVDNANFKYTVSKIYESAKGDSLKLSKYYVWYASLDFNLARYLLGFSNQYSVRLDQPNLTSVINGGGVFGSLSVDSTALFNSFMKH